MVDSKQCGVCGRVKPLSDYWVRSDNGKVRNTCKECQKGQAQMNRGKKVGCPICDTTSCSYRSEGVCDNVWARQRKIRRLEDWIKGRYASYKKTPCTDEQAEQDKDIVATIEMLKSYKQN